jgi:hypothetical protein
VANVLVVEAVVLVKGPELLHDDGNVDEDFIQLLRGFFD